MVLKKREDYQRLLGTDVFFHYPEKQPEMLCPADSMGFIYTKEEMLVIFEKAMKFYEKFSDEKIEQHNEELLDEYNLPKEYKATNKKPQPKKTKGTVYVVKAENNLCKIGKSINPEERLKGFKTMFPTGFEVVCLIKSDDMNALEQNLHKKYKNKRTNGEWFYLTDTDIIYLQELAMKEGSEHE